MLISTGPQIVTDMSISVLFIKAWGRTRQLTLNAGLIMASENEDQKKTEQGSKLDKAALL